MVILDLLNQCSMRKLVSTHTKDTLPKLHHKIHWQNMTAHKKCKVHKHWHWWHAVSRVKHCAHTLTLWETAIWSDRHSSYWAQHSTVIVRGILKQEGLEIFLFAFLQCVVRQDAWNGNETICSHMSTAMIKMTCFSVPLLAAYWPH